MRNARRRCALTVHRRRLLATESGSVRLQSACRAYWTLHVDAIVQSPYFDSAVLALLPRTDRQLPQPVLGSIISRICGDTGSSIDTRGMPVAQPPPPLAATPSSSTVASTDDDRASDEENNDDNDHNDDDLPIELMAVRRDTEEAAAAVAVVASSSSREEQVGALFDETTFIGIVGNSDDVQLFPGQSNTPFSALPSSFVSLGDALPVRDASIVSQHLAYSRTGSVL